MDFKSEFQNDFDFTVPKVTVTSGRAVLENITSIAMVSDNALSVSCGSRFVTVKGEKFSIKEICEGRIIIEGNIQGVELL